MSKNRSLFVIAVIVIVNALGYGIIIPVLYSYSLKYGLNDFQNGLLFSLFSVCQFLATPLIGRLSDKYGRKPLLLISISGTAFSFLITAFAPSAIWLFIARALDGITAGNLPVASAVISDTTTSSDRAKGFGIIGASFGFGFIFGPAIAAFTLPWGAGVPFLVAGVITLLAVVLTWLLLPETNKHLGEVKSGKLFDFTGLFKTLWDPQVGKTLFITLLYAFAFSLFIYGFQPFAVKILSLSAQQISIIFTLVGIMGVVAQALVIPRFTRRVGEKRALISALAIMVSTFAAFFIVRNYAVFVTIAMVNAVANAFVGPLIQALLSQEVDVKSQGSILGINTSYMSLGMIVGPIVGGAVANYFIPLPFLIGSILLAFCVFLATRLPGKSPTLHAWQGK